MVQNGRPYHTPICNVGFYIEIGGFLYVAAIDARQRAGLRRHDMDAVAIRTLIQYPKTINDNSWYINGNSCKTNN